MVRVRVVEVASEGGYCCGGQKGSGGVVGGLVAWITCGGAGRMQKGCL